MAVRQSERRIQNAVSVMHLTSIEYWVHVRVGRSQQLTNGFSSLLVDVAAVSLLEEEDVVFMF